VQLTLRPARLSGAEGDEYLVDTMLEVGLTDQFQVEAEWTALRRLDPDEGRSESGIGDLTLGVKYTFEEIAPLGLRTAIGFEITLPSGAGEVSENQYVYEPFLIVSKDLGDDGNLHLNLAYGFVDPDDGNAAAAEEGEGGGEGAPDELEFNLAAVYRPAPDWRLTLEFNLETNEVDSGDETESYLTPGFLWKGRDDLEFGLALAVGLNDDSDDWQAIGQLSYEFETF
jgi:hypothetical protein